MSDKFNYDEAVRLLEDCAALENTEVGEFWEQLARIHHRAKDMGSKEFLEAVEKEMLEQYNWIKENTKIVEVEETRNVKYRSLEFLNE